MLEQKILMELSTYIFDHMIEEEVVLYSEFTVSESVRNISLEEFIRDHKKPSFRETLFKFIDRTGESDASIYKKAWIDRKHFSKIRSNSGYRPKKNTVMALAFALELNVMDATELLNAAGYSLSESEKFDLVMKFCLERKIYRIENVNEALMYIGLKPLME
ncbi:hypothetical protein ACFOZY_06605 [Chungangia koreensis]|uniref:Regulatory protein RecX n=1 Tax=Chungangia koreensis TaxID=752657 RepID=A0ABV8X2E0_9LACT